MVTVGSQELKTKLSLLYILPTIVYENLWIFALLFVSWYLKWMPKIANKENTRKIMYSLGLQVQVYKL